MQISFQGALCHTLNLTYFVLSVINETSSPSCARDPVTARFNDLVIVLCRTDVGDLTVVHVF